ncbi:hypothetical protein [Nonomuraea pusilla]|uniref:Transmembrane transport protein n=1 Tax=Nonomuraea pusilla TaxID=46177 RepID=A0A1H7Z5T7_9ACTN|nr:hypothetical protein [Nonomuraea pusilla]SEM53561.1 hypothetical protein SAMN05660976_05408 [Nonomuraea pusilla]
MTEEPRLSAQDLIERLAPALSRRTRIGAVATLLAGVAGAVFMVTLWWSEPGPLPDRTQVAFAVLTVFCVAWAGYGGWLLTRRVVLFATDQVIAAWIGLAASLATTAVVTMTAVQRGTGVGLPLAVGGLFVAVALALAVRAHARQAALLRRLRELTDREEQ